MVVGAGLLAAGTTGLVAGAGGVTVVVAAGTTVFVAAGGADAVGASGTVPNTGVLGVGASGGAGVVTTGIGWTFLSTITVVCIGVAVTGPVFTACRMMSDRLCDVGCSITTGC